jgi:hypothetical protein
VSAAKQAKEQHDPDQLRQALNSSARYDGLEGQLDRYGAYEIGNGLIDVGAAWELLRTKIKTVEITSSVPVNTLLSGFLVTPGIGQGIHDREGVTAGQPYTRQYTFTRTNGPGHPINYIVSWVGNDGTFSSAGAITLRKNRPVTLDVTVNPATSGAHSAILNLDDPGTAGIDYQTMNVVVAADQFSAANNYSVTKSGAIGRNQTLSYFFNVPAGTPALRWTSAARRPRPAPGRRASCASTPTACRSRSPTTA